MDIFFQDPNEVPLPPDEVRILEFTAVPYPDGRRVKVNLEITPFQERPNLELTAVNENDQTVAEVSIIETMTRKLELTLHLRGPQTGGEHQLRAILFYSKLVQENQDDPDSAALEEPRIVDQGSVGFHVPEPAE